MKLLKSSARSIGVEVIVNGRAAPLKGLLQHFTHGPVKALKTKPGNPVGPLKRPDPRPVEGLIRINVSKACHEGLIEKQTFNPSSPGFEKRGKLLGLPLPGLAAQILDAAWKSVFKGRRECNGAEPSHVPKEKPLRGTHERKKKMRVRGQGL